MPSPATTSTTTSALTTTTTTISKTTTSTSLPHHASVIQWGTVPQWVSAVAAVLLFFAAYYLFFYGRRTNVTVTAQGYGVEKGWLLDIVATLTPVGAFRVGPYTPLQCNSCPTEVTSEYDGSWIGNVRCEAETLASRYAGWDWRPWSQLRLHRKGMVKRRARWGCPNRKVPYIEVCEVSVRANAEPPDVVETPVLYVFNPFGSEFAESQETTRRTHVVLVPSPDEDVVGWRVILNVLVPMETWSIRRPSRDSWGWRDDDYVPRATDDVVSEAVKTVDGLKLRKNKE